MQNTYLYYLISIIICLIGCSKDADRIDIKILNELIKEGDNKLYYGNYSQSFDAYNQVIQALDIKNKSLGEKKVLIRAHSGVGIIYENLGLKKKAFDNYDKALEIAERADLIDHQIITLVNMAYLEESPREILNILSEVPEIAKESTNIYTDQYLCRLAQVYVQDGRFTEGISIFDSLIYKYSNDSLIIDYFYRGKGLAYHKLEMYEKAIENFDFALNFLNQQESKEIIKVDVLIDKALSLIKIGDYESSIEELVLCKDFIDRSGDIVRKRKVKEIYLEYYRQKKELKNQLNVSNELRELDNEKAKAQNEIQGSIYANLKISELEKENELETSKSRLRYLLIGLCVLTLFIYHLFYRNKSKIKLLEKQQQVKDEQAKRKDLQNKLAQESLNAYMNGQEEERKQHAAQLHDNLGANLAAVNMHLSLLKKDVPEKKYDRISSMLKNVITETRNISHNIMPPLLVNQGIIAAITEKAIEWTCPELQFEVEPTIEKVILDDNLEIALYRGILECMKNTIDNANASQVKIIFEQLENNSLHITIIDNGEGFDISIIDDGKGGLGINGFKNRIKYFKGNFKIESEIGKGTTVQINVPLKEMKKTA